MVIVWMVDACSSAWLQQPCHALLLIPRPSVAPLKGERAGIYGCGLSMLSVIMKTRHCISGCGRVVLSGLSLARGCLPGCCHRSRPAVKRVEPLRGWVWLTHLTPSWNGIAPASLRAIARNVIARHEAKRSDPFMTDLWKIYFKTSISFPITYPTANAYSRLQTLNQRLGLDKVCIFVA